MQRCGFKSGAFTAAAAFIIGGALAVSGASAVQTATIGLGYASIALGIVLLIWSITIDGEHWWEKFKRKPIPISPIHVDDGFHVDCDPVADEGGLVTNVYSVAVCLWVTNTLKTGAVLRNLRAHLHFSSGEAIHLPIRDFVSGTVDLRDGEVAKIEVGRMLHRVIGTIMPAMIRAGGHIQTTSKFMTEHRPAPEQLHRSFYISRADGQKPSHGFGQVDDESKIRSIIIVISADECLSKTVKLQTNFFAFDARDWFQFLQDDGANA